MEAEGLNFDRLRGILDQFEGIEVHVIGDTIVDSLTYTTMIGGMTKTPTPSVRFDSRVRFCRRRRHRRQAPAGRRRRSHILNRARRRRFEGLRA